MRASLARLSAMTAFFAALALDISVPAAVLACMCLLRAVGTAYADRPISGAIGEARTA